MGQTTTIEFKENGKTYKLVGEVLSPKEDSDIPIQDQKFSGKHVIMYSGYCLGVGAYKVIAQKISNMGGTVVLFDYRGWGESKQTGALKDEKTICKDVEVIYDYVRNTLGVLPKDIYVFGHSMGGATGSHVALYAAKKQEYIGHLILQGPMAGIPRSTIQYMKDENLSLLAYPAAALNWFLQGCIFSDKMSTAKNLLELSKYNKNIPIDLSSGDENDWLSLKFTKIDEKIKNAGFEKLKITIEPGRYHTASIDILKNLSV